MNKHQKKTGFLRILSVPAQVRALIMCDMFERPLFGLFHSSFRLSVEPAHRQSVHRKQCDAQQDHARAQREPQIPHRKARRQIAYSS